MRFIGVVMSLSFYLRETFVSNPQFLDPLRIMIMWLVSRLESLLGEIAAADQLPDVSENLLMQRLRRLKCEMHGLIALEDLSGILTGAGKVSGIGSAGWLTKRWGLPCVFCCGRWTGREKSVCRTVSSRRRIAA